MCIVLGWALCTRHTNNHCKLNQLLLSQTLIDKLKANAIRVVLVWTFDLTRDSIPFQFDCTSRSFIDIEIQSLNFTGKYSHGGYKSYMPQTNFNRTNPFQWLKIHISYESWWIHWQMNHINGQYLKSHLDILNFDRFKLTMLVLIKRLFWLIDDNQWYKQFSLGIRWLAPVCLYKIARLEFCMMFFFC